MKELVEARQRYQRLLDALGKNSRIDRELRAELIEAIDIMDRKISRMSRTANSAMRPESGSAAVYRGCSR